ncbi:P-type conjugative transfer protein TrbL [Acidithiobacillus caldus]|uniref:P-type conjugative transfer protein TrbL n=1 Tax=Acidithiobacillus caldus TaxID=33059 RepID=UPI001C066D13|nr:P-type conjugative transfer protein TrbL [Acidithiobacillus caldus]MBU2770128.1 P-type conjugative transfer protein TrbL [Acidithiobacillus caldus]
MNLENFSSNGINTIANQFQSATSGWMSTADHIALQIFGALAVLEFVWAGATLMLRKNDLPDMITGVLLKVVSLAFFFTLIIEAPTWVPDIIQSFWDIGGQISGQPVQSPNAILLAGINMGAKVIDAVMNAASVWHPEGAIVMAAVAGLTALFILAGMLILALQLIVALIEAFIVVGGGAVMMGFLGSRWTSTWGEKYFGYAVSVGVKLLAVELITGLAFGMVHVWQTQLANLPQGVLPIVGALFDIGTGTLLIGALSIMVPSIASSLMNGSPSLSLGNMGAAGAAVAGGTIAAGAGALMGGASLANTAIGAGKGVGALAGSANSAMGGMKGLGAAFQEGAGSANESGILGLGAGTVGARTVGGLAGLAGQAASGIGTAGMQGLKAAGGMASARFHGTSGRSAQGIAANLGDKAIQGWGETTAGGNFANRIRAQVKDDPKGNSVGLGAVPDVPGKTSGPVGDGPTTATDPNAGASMGSTTSAGNTEGSTAAGIPGERLGNTAAGIQNDGVPNRPNDGVPNRPNDGIQSKPGGDGFSGGSGNNGLAGQGLGPRFDPRPDHEKHLDVLDDIKKRLAPGGINDGGHGGAGGPRINHTE